jgi:hypothetical protein
LTAVVRKKLGLTLLSEKPGEERIYRIIAKDIVPKQKGSKASMASCLVPVPVEAAGMRPGFVDLFATLLARAILVFEGLLLCDIGGSFWW